MRHGGMYRYIEGGKRQTRAHWAREVHCHDRDIPSQPSHVYSCLLAVQTPPEHSLTKPEPIPGLPELICSIPEEMLHRRLLSKHSRSGEHHSWTPLTIPNEPETSQIPSTNPELARSPLNPKTQYAQLRSGKARTLSILPNWVSFLFSRAYYYLSVLTLVSFSPVTPSSVNPVSD